jgi:putative ABC transport system permease protein
MFRRRRPESDFSEEIRAHLELEEEAMRDAGASSEDARAKARRAFGSPTSAEERFYETSRWVAWEVFRQDVRFAARTLARNPGFAAAAVLTLALGIGANTAIFSVVNAVLVSPLPFASPDRLVLVYGLNEGRDRQSLGPADYLDLRSESRSFERLAAVREGSFNLAGRERPEIVRGAVVTPDFFPLLGTLPMRGRALRPDRDGPGGPRSVVLGARLWRSRFGGDVAVVGRSVTIDAEPYTVVGVVPPEFELPAGAEMWMSSPYAVPPHPLRPAIDPSPSRDTHYIEVFGRLAPGVSTAAASSEVNSIFARWKRELGDKEGSVGGTVVALRDDLVGAARPALGILLGAVTLLLLIACSNVANIVLARGTQRQREIAIRAALGAGRMRLVRQLLTESVVLASAGGALGLLLAHAAMAPLRAMVPSGLLVGSRLELDGRVLFFTAAVSLGSGILFGLFPALQLAGRDFDRTLKESGRGVVGARAQRTRSALVVTEIALAAVLLLGAGLLIRSFDRLLSVSQGFDPEGLLTARLNLPVARYPEPAARTAAVRAVLEKIRALPGASAAAVVSRLPLNQGASRRGVDVEGIPDLNFSPDYQVVTEDYFRAMRIPILRGRAFDGRDSAAGPGAIIVSESLARRLFSGKDPVGRRMKVGLGDEWSSVIGVSGDVRQHRLEDTSVPTVYVPYSQDPWPLVTVVLRTSVPPETAAAALDRAVRSVDPEQALSNVRPMRQVISESVSAQRLRMVLLGLFAFLALVLACVGLYGVMAYSVAQRAREIGIRMALGAAPARVLRLVVGQGLRLALVGLAAGLLLSFVFGRLMASLLYEVRPTDAATFAGISVLLSAVAFLASYVPAWRATRVDPAVVLRGD